ncbi:hypothetical protein LSCM1_00077 [Leishmania martiniquensis]|uniref:XPC-binding domain-containing protein n=1 Tax=Leishmania martiniquensis TaxID=1580590 RepID=A0A836G0J2_9TRYP|nr:hypothetical protein LSCM1_00077 [Leishmania martiniquensis]
MSGRSSSSVTPVTVRSISGKSVMLMPPVTLATLLKVAVAPPFSLEPESVKIFLHGRLVRLLQYQKQHGSDLLKFPLDASPYTPSRTPTRCTHSTVALESPSPSGTELKDAPCSIIVYGVPQRIRAASSATRTGAQEQAIQSTTFAGESLAVSTLPNIGSEESLASAGTAAAAAPTAAPVRRRASFTQSLNNTPTANAASLKGPLPYPHSPDGLRELDKICAEFDSDDDDDLITLLQGAPQSIYNHPTVLYMSNKVKGNLVVLQAVMQQVASVSPAFFDWIAENPQKFLSALNRGGERSLQQVKEQLRMLAMRAMAEQMSGEAPSRHVMMLEVNTSDGSPDVYQVEVQVGDFSGRSTPSDSLMATTLVNSSSEEEENGGDEESMSTGTELEDNRTASSSVKAPSEGADAAEAAEREEEREPHRGAILLPGSPGPLQAPLSAQLRKDVVPPDGGSMAAGEKTASPQERGAPSVPPPPVDAVPPRTACRSSTPLLFSSSAAAVSASFDAAVSSALAAVSNPQEDDAEDARLSWLQKEQQRIDSLMQEWILQATNDAAQRAHTAITELRRRFLTLLNDLITTSTTPALLCRNGRDVRRLAILACRFFSGAEEFYAQLDEQGVRSSVFGETPQESVAAWAVVAALSRLLICDVDTAIEQQQQGPLGTRREDDPLSLRESNSIWAIPALRWVTSEGPEKLLMALLKLCRQQRAVVLWYSSHYVVKEVGKTIQTVAYILGGTGEAQQTVSLRRLKMTSKAHKQDEVADCMAALSSALTEAGAVPESTRLQWFALMRSRYQRLVLPLEKDLPTPHMTSNPLYVCDTRHVLPPKASGARPNSSRGTMDSAARWWAGYCDDRHTCCADKWCLAITARPWNTVTAMETTAVPEKAEGVAVVLVDDRAESSAANSSLPNASAHDWLAQITWMPAETVVAPSAAGAAASVPGSVTRHSAVLCEQVWALTGEEEEVAVADRLPPVAGVSDGPLLFSGDLHIVDVSAMEGAQRPVLSLAGGAALRTYLATVVRNFVLPPSAREPIFLRHLFGMFEKHPRIPVAAAVREAALLNARLQDSPWLVSEYVLFDYGGALATFSAPYASAAARAGMVTASASSTTAACELPPPKGTAGGPASDQFVRMPSVPLSQRLSAPRPVPPTHRRPERANLLSGHERSPVVPGEVAKRQYARSHAVDELYEMMLGSLLEHKPIGEANVLDHLVRYVDASQDAMRGRVCGRQAEASSAAAQKELHETTPDHALKAGRSSNLKPQPPNGKRNSFQRRRQ